MLATEIIADLKRKIRILWAIIIILTLLLIGTNINNFQREEETDGQNLRSTTEDVQLVYDIPEQPIGQNKIAYRKRSKKR